LPATPGSPLGPCLSLELLDVLFDVNLESLDDGDLENAGAAFGAFSILGHLDDLTPPHKQMER